MMAKTSTAAEKLFGVIGKIGMLVAGWE